VSEAKVLSLERLVVVENHGVVNYVPLQPGIIIAFHELCLVSADGDLSRIQRRAAALD
jgi:hypothetical protein